jgi:hypothetical protein
LPESHVEFRKKFNPQEENKEEPTIRDFLTESVAQFSDIVIQAEQEAEKTLIEFQTKKDKLNVK